MREPRFYENPGCAEVGGDLWFPEKKDGANTRELMLARAICRKCPHQTECAEWGVAKEIHGIWGGTTPMERRVLRRRMNILLKEDDVA